MLRLLILLALMLPGAAMAQDLAAAEAGMRLYRADNVDCEMCHGWLGGGRYHDTQYSDVTAGGPSLIKSTMTREEMIERISCGKMMEGRILVMPQYLGNAWTNEHKCYGGKVKADVPWEETPLQGLKQMTPAQIEQVVTYIQTVYQGKGMTLEWCQKYWTTTATQRACDTLIQPVPLPNTTPPPGAAPEARPAPTGPTFLPAPPRP